MVMDSFHNEFKMKLVMLGNTGVGKSSIVDRYIFERFAPMNHTSTIGAQFNTKRVSDKYRIDIWDTAGQERFRTLIPMYVRNSHIVVITVSIEDSEESMNEQIAYWLKYFKDNTYSNINASSYRVIVVYNKIDLAGSVVPSFKHNKSTDADDIDSQIFMKMALSCKTGRNFDVFTKSIEKVCEELEPTLTPIVYKTVKPSSEEGVVRRMIGSIFSSC